MSTTLVKLNADLSPIGEAIDDGDVWVLVNTSDIGNEPTGETVKASSTEIRNYLAGYFRGLSEQIGANEGYSTAFRTVPLDGNAWTPDPLQGQAVNFSGLASTPFNLPANPGFTSCIVTAGQAASIGLTGYVEIGTRPAGIGVLELRSDGATAIAIWGGA